MRGRVHAADALKDAGTRWIGRVVGAKASTKVLLYLELVTAVLKWRRSDVKGS